MRYLILLLILLTACGPRSTIKEEGAKGLTDVAANNEAVADEIGEEHPAEAAVLDLGAHMIKGTLKVTANDEMKALLLKLEARHAAKVESIKQRLHEDADKYVVELKQQYTEQIKAIEEESQPWYVTVLGVAGAASVLGIVARTAIGIFGGPAWLVTAVNGLVGVSRAAKKIKVAKDTIGSAEAGREALRQVDEMWGSKLEKVGIGSVEDVFKTASKAWAVDNGNHTDVHSLVKTVRETMETKNGRPKAVAVQAQPQRDDISSSEGKTT
ncbi:MAG: hypothetical protein JRC86_12225 [Deltaproteobacteria bacterium]|nr:hypothetical protein [Deltaproteobacteria bacterium]